MKDKAPHFSGGISDAMTVNMDRTRHTKDSCDNCGLPLKFSKRMVLLGDYNLNDEAGRPLAVHPWCYAIMKERK